MLKEHVSGETELQCAAGACTWHNYVISDISQLQESFQLVSDKEVAMETPSHTSLPYHVTKIHGGSVK